MPYDPKQIATDLIVNHGLDSAVMIALDQAIKSQEDQDLYALSIWREVKSFLRTEVNKNGVDATSR
jgi:hypothetical protein